MQRLFFLFLSLAVTLTASGQNERKFVRSGNKLFIEAVKDTTRLDTMKFGQAEEYYRKALNKKPGNAKWDFNLADALYKQMRFEEAERKFGELTEKLESDEEKARVLHNQGNSMLMQQKIDESIESYKEALRKNPEDIETKYNLAYAQMLKNQQQQNQQNQQNQQQNQNQNQNQQDQQNQQQNQQQDQQNQQNQQDKQNQQDQQNRENQDQNRDQQQQQNKISRDDAEQLLQALENDERDIQEKVKKEKAAKARKFRTEKEW